MVERLTVESVGHRGDGVATVAGEAVFIPYALPGEEVSVEAVPGYPDRRRLLRVETESPERIAPFCLHFGVCGGCAIQHWREDAYRAWKRGLVVTALEQAGLSAPVDELVDAHGAGRRRIVLHARRGVHDTLQVGFAAPRAHHIIPIDRCPILVPALNRAIEIAWHLAEALGPLRKPLDLQFTASDTGLDVDIRGSGPLAPQRQIELARLAADAKLARLTRHGELIAQAVAPAVRMGRADVPIPAGAFLQATAAGEETLARLVADHIGTARHIADLFCGVGPFALRLAERARIAAFDSDEPALAALRQAAATTQGLKPITIRPRDLFRQPLTADELKAFDAVVFDPPRQGAQTQARELARSKVPTIVAVSCNPATFARDARLLVDGGYRLARVTPVDQFRHSAHVEVVGLFTR